MMKSNKLFKRILLMALLCAVVIGIFVLGVFIYHCKVTARLSEMLNQWEVAERAVYAVAQTPYTEEQIDEKCNLVCSFYTNEMKEKSYPHLYDTMAEISAMPDTMVRFDRIVTDIRADYRYGEIRVYMDCTVDFEGYGGYLSEEFEENIIKRGKCVYTFKITEGEDGYLINDIEIDWENKGL